MKLKYNPPIQLIPISLLLCAKMAPINMKEVNDLIQAFGDAVPYLKPASATITLIAKALEKVKENKQQCLYLFMRSARLYKELNELAQGRWDTDGVRNTEEFLK